MLSSKVKNINRCENQQMFASRMIATYLKYGLGSMKSGIKSFLVIPILKKLQV